MTDEEFLRQSYVGLEVNRAFSEAMVLMRDNSRLHFCHRVGERWAKAAGAGGDESMTTLAGQVLSRIDLFRLNAKHLDLQFNDGSRWEARFGDAGTGC